MGENQRFDLAIVQTGRHYGKHLVLDMQGNRFAIIGPDDLDEEGYLEYAFQLSKKMLKSCALSFMKLSNFFSSLFFAESEIIMMR